jgi:hypothetical protein
LTRRAEWHERAARPSSGIARLGRHMRRGSSAERVFPCSVGKISLHRPAKFPASMRRELSRKPSSWLRKRSRSARPPAAITRSLRRRALPPPSSPQSNAMAPGTVLHFPRVPSLEAFGRRPQCQTHRREGPSSETLHNRGSEAVTWDGLYSRPSDFRRAGRSLGSRLNQQGPVGSRPGPQRH